MPIMFGDRKKMAAVASGGSNQQLKPEVETDDRMKTLHALAKDAIDAMSNGSAADFARAMKAFFYECDAGPHKEGSHE